MINVIGLWCVFGVVLCGWGLLVRRLLRIRRSGTIQLVWFGYAAVVAILQLVSLIAPVALAAVVITVAGALVGWIVERRQVSAWWRRVRHDRSRIALVIAAALVTLATAFAAQAPIELYDTGLYHLQTVKWLNEYGVVRGLGNLHFRFAYNNSVHLFDALADAFWQGMAAHVANAFLTVLAIVQCLVELFAARSPRGRLRQAFCLIALPLFVAALWTPDLVSLSSDLPLAVFSFAAILELISLQDDDGLILALALASVALTTKLGGLALFASVVAFALWRLRRAPRAKQVAAAALPGLLVAGWLARGIITSGWLLYPVFGQFPFAWSVTRETAHYDLSNIQSWARMFGKPPEELFAHGFWYWFIPWLEGFRASREIVLFGAAIAALIWRRGTDRNVLAIVVVGLSLLQWFVGAPSLRYGGYLFWLLAAAALAPLLVPALRTPSTRPLVFVVAVAYLAWAGAFAIRGPKTELKWWGRLAAPPHATTSFDGTYSPDKGDQCWDAPLPCSPMPGRSLRRSPDELGAGFLPSPYASQW